MQEAVKAAVGVTQEPPEHDWLPVQVVCNCAVVAFEQVLDVVPGLLQV